MKQTDWISVKDRLPKINERVLVCRQFEDNTFFTYIATYTGKERIKDVSHYWWYTDDGFDIDGITHWQKIVLPKKKVMKISSNIVLKRYTADKGKSLKWYEWVMNPNTRECERALRYAECTAVIDTKQLDGDVMEIPYKEYKEWWDNNYHCLGITGL